MATEIRTAVVARDPATADAVKAALGAGAVMAAVCRDLVALMTELEREAVPVVIVDGGPDPMATLEALEPVVNRYAQSRFVVLVGELSGDMYLRAMEVGVRKVLSKENLGRDLPEVIERIARGAAQPAAPMGSMYTVLSAAGGCGATTLALNLAHELQLAKSEPALLVDMDYAYGAVAAYLGLQSQYGVADVLRHTGGVDAHLVRTTAVHAAERLYALLSPASINLGGAGAVAPDVLEQVFPAFKQGFSFTVVDAPRVSMDVAETLVRASEAAFIVFQPSVKDVRHAKTMLTELASRGAPMDRFRPILNRYRKRRQMISVEDAQKALGDYPMECLSNDYASVIRGVNYGQPLAEAAPRSTLRRELTRLAAHTAGLSNGRVRF